jgi:lysozyme
MTSDGDQNTPARGPSPSRRQLGLALASGALTLSIRNMGWAAKETFPTIKTKIPALSLLEQLQGQKAVLPQGVPLRPVNKRGLTLTEASEGFVGHLYNDSANYCTVAYGRLIKKSPCDGSEPSQYRGTISRPKGEQWLVEDMSQAQIHVITGVTDPDNLTPDQYASLCDFVFNVGGGNFEKSTLLQVVNARQFDRVPTQFRRWVSAGGRPFPGLVKRRNAEVALFFYGSAIPKAVPIPGEDLRPLNIFTGDPV